MNLYVSVGFKVIARKRSTFACFLTCSKSVNLLVDNCRHRQFVCNLTTESGSYWILLFSHTSWPSWECLNRSQPESDEVALSLSLDSGLRRVLHSSRVGFNLNVDFERKTSRSGLDSMRQTCSRMGCHVTRSRCLQWAIIEMFAVSQ